MPNHLFAYTKCRLTKMPGAMRPPKYLILQASCAHPPGITRRGRGL
jgi:hypothetical protein